MNGYFKKQIEALRQRHEALLQRPNEMQEETNGVIRRYVYPVLTRQHIPLEWRYDFNPATNPCCMERIGFNATMNSGALKWNGKYLMVVRVEGADRKSFFAIAESPNGVARATSWRSVTVWLSTLTSVPSAKSAKATATLSSAWILMYCISTPDLSSVQWRSSHAHC